MAMTGVVSSLRRCRADHATALHGMTWMRETFTVNSTPSSLRYLGCLSLDFPRRESLARENPFKHDLFPSGPGLSGIRLRLLPWDTRNGRRRLITLRFRPGLCYSW